MSWPNVHGGFINVSIDFVLIPLFQSVHGAMLWWKINNNDKRDLKDNQAVRQLGHCHADLVTEHFVPSMVVPILMKVVINTYIDKRRIVKVKQSVP